MRMKTRRSTAIIGRRTRRTTLALLLLASGGPAEEAEDTRSAARTMARGRCPTVLSASYKR